MTLDPRRVAQVARDEFGKLPHPDVPEVTNAEYPVYERVAAMKRNPHPPSVHDVRDAYHEITQSGISPQQWEQAWKVARPLANRLLGRDPDIGELIRLAEAHPDDIHKFYSALPSPSHPEIQAGEMARVMHMANPHSIEHLDRGPLLREVAHFAASGYSSADIYNHYQRMKDQRESA